MSEPVELPKGDEYVLVVDDEDEARESLQEVVEMAGCSAALAANGAEALEMLRRRRPCLMILDLRMPVMTGAELLEAMKQDPTLADVPVVVSTSSPNRAPPGVPVLAKPIDIAALWGWMKRTCACAAAAPSTLS